MAKYRPRKISTDKLSTSKYRVVKYGMKNIKVAKYQTQIIIEGVNYRKQNIEKTKHRKTKYRKTKYRSGIISNRQDVECKTMEWQNIERKLSK